jgi:hypothetical protein
MDFSRSFNTTDVISPQDTTSFSQFRLFSKLPIELRLAIWELMTLSPRRVPLHDRKYELYGHMDPYPTIFKVNQESRALALKLYIAFRTFKYIRDLRHGPRQYHYLYPKNDFAVTNLWSMGGCSRVFAGFINSRGGREVIRGVRKLMFTGNHLNFADLLGENARIDHFKPNMHKSFERFEALEEVVVELRRCNYPASMSRKVRTELGGKDTSDVTARLMEREFPVFLDVLPKKPKFKVIVVDWQDGLPEGYFLSTGLKRWRSGF